MISAIWLLPTFLAGVAFGIFLIALCHAGGKY